MVASGGVDVVLGSIGFGWPAPRELDATETFKQKKGELAREGFDPGAVSDPLFMLDPKTGAYVALDAETFAQINDGTIRL